MAFSVNLKWSHSDVASLLADGYDRWAVEVEDPAPAWNSVAPVQAWPIIATGHTDYVFTASVASINLTGSVSLPSFRARPYRSADQSFHPTEIVSVDAALGGYCDIADIRAQGYLETAYDNGKVQAGIEKATAEIDRICRQWFEPRYRRVSLDGKKIDTLWLEVPIITMMEFDVDLSELSLDEFVIYNRHLTHGIVNPDDRQDPRISWGDGRSPVDVRRLYGGGRFPKARKSVTALGVFGYTDVGSGYIGETSEGSQIPLTYGETPSDIKIACARLAIMNMLPFEDAQDFINAGKVIRESTRDQSYSLANPAAGDGAYGFTGDTAVDNILMRYMGPISVGVV